VIQPIGNCLSQDENGFIINDLSLDMIDHKWRTVLRIIKNNFVKNLDKNLYSIYVRGSVARGLAIEGISDLDMFSLVKPSFSKEKFRWQGADFQSDIVKNIKEKYDFVSDVEMIFATYEEYFSDSNLAIIVNTQSVLLFGKSIVETLKRYKADESMILNYH
jgi:predicted nucleotidyltransferase